MKSNRSYGFTLLELLVVIGVIGTLSVVLILLINPLGQLQKAHDSKRKTDLKQIQIALELYRNTHGHYPPMNNQYEIKDEDANKVIPWGSPWPPYINILPIESSERKYVYYSTGSQYALYASLERGSQDSEACTIGSQCASSCASICTNGIPTTQCAGSGTQGTVFCNYELDNL